VTADGDFFASAKVQATAATDGNFFALSLGFWRWQIPMPFYFSGRKNFSEMCERIGA
jgi:hypothetical protein